MDRWCWECLEVREYPWCQECGEPTADLPECDSCGGPIDGPSNLCSECMSVPDGIAGGCCPGCGADEGSHDDIAGICVECGEDWS
jgi:predicted amidophosphoribosyltransferase